MSAQPGFDEALQKLQGIFDKLFLSKVELSPTLAAKDVPEWDSLMQINLVLAVEKAFGIRFRLGEVEEANDVGEFVGLILTRMKAA
jgi:acyl carrier protein